METAAAEKYIEGTKSRNLGAGARRFIAFLALAAALAGVVVPSYLVKRGAAHSLFEDLTFTRIAVEARQNIQKIEYGIKNGKDLEQFHNMNAILRDIQRCSSYVDGVYVVSRGDELLYSLEQPSDGGVPLRRPRALAFENENDYYLSGDSEFFDLFLPVFDTDGRDIAYIIIRLDKDVVFYPTSELVGQEWAQSLIIALEALGIGLIIILRKKPRLIGSAVIIFIAALVALSADMGLAYARHGGITESAAVQSVNRIAQMLQSDVDTLRAKGVSADAIYDQNSWLQRSVNGIPMIHSRSINSNMRVALTVSRAYISQYSAALLRSYAVIYAGLFAAGAAAVAGRVIYTRKRKIVVAKLTAGG